MGDAQMIADMANKAEQEILAQACDGLVRWYCALPRERRVEIAAYAAKKVGIIK